MGRKSVLVKNLFCYARLSEQVGDYLWYRHDTRLNKCGKTITKAHEIRVARSILPSLLF